MLFDLWIIKQAGPVEDEIYCQQNKYKACSLYIADQMLQISSKKAWRIREQEHILIPAKAIILIGM